MSIFNYPEKKINTSLPQVIPVEFIFYKEFLEIQLLRSYFAIVVRGIRFKFPNDFVDQYLIKKTLLQNKDQSSSIKDHH